MQPGTHEARELQLWSIPGNAGRNGERYLAESGMNGAQFDLSVRWCNLGGNTVYNRPCGL
jgi:hypothetical protein